MKEPSIHRCPIQHPECSSIGIGQNRFAAELGDNLLIAARDCVERFVPGNPLPYLGGPAIGRDAFRPDSPHRIQHTIGRVHAIQILRYLGAEEPLGYGMCGIALNFCRLPIFYRDEHTAGVRTIVRTGGVNDFLHFARLYVQCEAGTVDRKQKRGGAKPPHKSQITLHYGSTRTCPATTIGLPEPLSNTKPRVTKLAAPADCRPANPLTFSKVVKLPV